MKISLNSSALHKNYCIRHILSEKVSDVQLERLKKTVICCDPWDRPLSGFPNAVYSPVLYSLGPGTRLCRRAGNMAILSPRLPGFDISRFAGGVPISAAVREIEAFAGKYGAMLHGGTFGKVLSGRLNCPVYLPDITAQSPSFEASIAGLYCPVIKPVCCFVKYIDGEKNVIPVTYRQMSEMIEQNKVKTYFSNTHKCMYGSMKLNGGFGFLLFDTVKTVTEKCRLAENLNKTPVLYYQELKSLIQNPL